MLLDLVDLGGTTASPAQMIPPATTGNDLASILNMSGSVNSPVAQPLAMNGFAHQTDASGVEDLLGGLGIGSPINALVNNNSAQSEWMY